MLFRSPRPSFPRRGVTLIEMLVSVALLVLMMTIIVQVFAAATTAVSGARTYQELDSTLRQIDSTLRTDLSNITARLTPPINPIENKGYFEYGENSFADLKGEDTDDYVRFTVKAPEGQLFTGRMFANPSLLGLNWTGMTAAERTTYLKSQPITIQSQFAEVIYFLRNGNLYRRVLLVAPERQSSIMQTDLFGNTPPHYQAGHYGGTAGPLLSWQGMNDLSAHPAPTGQNLNNNAIVLNTLGDLTNRENRFGYSRFGNDFSVNPNPPGNVSSTPDFIPDDQNQDTVPDFYPSLYFNLVNPGGYYQNVTNGNIPLVNEPQNWFGGVNPRSGKSADTMAFPYTFPGAYSKPDPITASAGVGWIHTPDPSLNLSTLTGLRLMNHNPVDIGDSLPLPSGLQTWWGFPTWRETISPNWLDPFTQIQVAGAQPNGLHPLPANVIPPVFALTNILPPMTQADVSFGASISAIPTPYRLSTPYGTDGGGSGFFAFSPGFAGDFGATWRNTYEDDLIATGVRSFDIKAYDNAAAAYVDLGWGDDLRIVAPGNLAAVPPFVSSTSLTTTWNGSVWNTFTQTFAHEGRMPPLEADNRADYAWPLLTPNVGDDTHSITRLRRVWDSWSTDYSIAPATGVNPVNGQPLGPPFGLPIYPSYPPPYQQPLRGLQIQIRVVDPKNERIKTLTIRQDFSDKL